jgi:flap endonuclease-1
MGVGDLNSFLSTLCPSAFGVCYLHQLAGCKLAIDAPIMVKRYSSIIHKNMLAQLGSPIDEYDQSIFYKQLKHDIVCFLLKLMKHGITPIVVFDGEIRPEKEECIAERRKLSKIRREKLSAAYLNYVSKNPLEVTRADHDNLIKLRSYEFISGRPLTPEEYSKQISNYSNLMAVKDVLQFLSIPVLTAPFDAEKLCSSLYMDGHVTAVFSNDTDNYALGSGFTISKILPNGAMDVVSLHEIINKFQQEFNCDQTNAYYIFVDFCIMCGCDFNKNIPGIATAKSLKLLKKYGCIENVAQEKDITCLKHVRCREIFSREPSCVSIEMITIDPHLFLSKMQILIHYFQSEMLNESFSNVNMESFRKIIT